MAYQLRLFGPIQALMGLYTSLATVRVSLGRAHEILDVAPEVVEAATPVSLSTARGELALDDVSFSFERGAPVLEHVSLRVAPGECVAIVGLSGSGKSTIADLVLRLLDPQAGTVRLDGHDLRTLKLADLRACVALVDQEPAVFHSSIADNIRYAQPSATATDVDAAARSAGLDAFVAMLPDGYETTVGERGAAFSAGERQRVAVARALLVDPGGAFGSLVHVLFPDWTAGSGAYAMVGPAHGGGAGVGTLAVRGEVQRRTETGDAPVWQGATRENTGSIRPRSNVDRRDAAPVECSWTFTTGGSDDPPNACPTGPLR